jgi:hypothetical protein
VTVTLPVRELERQAAAPTPGVIMTGDEGLVEALASITGVVDNVGDLIVPGSYRRTLGERKPKGIFSLDTKVWTARTEAIEELLPGDPRLPKTLSGQVGGIGAFPEGEDGVPVFVPVDVPGLEVLRQWLTEALDAAGITYAANHGYTPHVTLKYADAGEPMPDPVPPVPVSFDGLIAAVDNEPTPVPFTAAEVRMPG